MKKLIKVDSEGKVHEIYSEYFIDWKKDHAKMIPIDHPDDSITTHKLRNKVVTTEKINNLAVTTEKINDTDVTTSKIKDLNVTAEKINEAAVITSKIADLNVTTEKIADLNVTHEKLNEDMNLRGKLVIVDTPVSSNYENEYPDTSDISDVYTKTVIDQKLSGKADTIHEHEFPDAIKNPCYLIINGIPYNGESETIVDVLGDESLMNIENKFLVVNDKIENHTHEESEITNIDKYTKNETDMKNSELMGRIMVLETRISELESETN